jgi:hypothetical protein
MTQALDPNEAATLFRSGTALAFLADPETPFVMGRWMNQPALCLPSPDDPVAYFTTYPVIVYGTYAPSPPGEAVRAVITISAAGWTARGYAMAVALPKGKAVDLTIAFEDDAGNPAEAPGAVTWTSSDDEIATVDPDADDDTEAVATAVAEGAATITGSSNGISATIDIDVTVEAGGAVTANISAGEPYQPGAENLPEPPPGENFPDQGLPTARRGAPLHPGAPGQGVRPGQPQQPARAGVRVAAAVSRPAPPQAPVRPGQPIQRPR